MLQRFPGRTLEELDHVDWGRLQRAWAVQGLLRVEDARELSIRKKYQPTRNEWRQIQRHDDLLKETDE